jgi:hypothetical protein
VSPTPKRYQFDTPVPSFEPRPLPAQRPTDAFPEPRTRGDLHRSGRPEDVVTPQIIHVHQAPPDRTVQRLALGAGMGAGAVAAAVYFGPLLIASLEAMAVVLLAGTLGIAVLAWAIVHVVGGVRAEGRGRRRR